MGIQSRHHLRCLQHDQQASDRQNLATASFKAPILMFDALAFQADIGSVEDVSERICLYSQSRFINATHNAAVQSVNSLCY